MTDAAISVTGAKKRYRIYRRHETTLKSTIIRGRRGVYDEFAALDGVSFEIPHGQAVGIVGRNGAGKSTLLKLLARIIEPDHTRRQGRTEQLAHARTARASLSSTATTSFGKQASPGAGLE